MNLFKVLAVFLSVCLLCTEVAAAGRNNSEPSSDMWLKAKIVTAYTLNQHLNPFKLDVEVNNGVAHLSGTVDSDVERDLAVEIAKGVEGIKSVKENIKVEPGAAAEGRQESAFFRTVEDATITAKVKSKLLWNRNTKGLDISVTTENGVVTLQGIVASDTHRDLAVQLAKNTSGVERVKSRLEVAETPEQARKDGTLETMEIRASDAWITTKVKSMLLFSREAEGSDIIVSTTDQVVTLKGTVVSEEQKGKILQIVRDTVGVKDVRSLLVVDKG